jgi:phosphinothricin tripeptide acetyl hydrolase
MSGIARVRQHLAKLPPADSMALAERRAQYDRAERVFAIPPDLAVEPVSAAGVAAEWLRPATPPGDAALLYLHGGGYAIGSLRSHRHLAAAIASAAGVPVLLLDYRLAPEHPFPAAVEDAVAAYRWLLARGIPSGRLAVAGDSAGGGLTVATLLALRDAGVAMPAAAVCISPWVDLAGGAPSHAGKAPVDPILTAAALAEYARLYLGDRDPRTPLASPLFGDLRGLPPLYVQVGSEEMLLDDAVRLAERARQAGVDVTLEVWDDMIHVWSWFLSFLDEAAEAVARIGTFVGERAGGLSERASGR